MEKMSPEKAMSILKQHGTIVTHEEAKLIVDFLYKLASISVEIYMNREKNLDKKD
jgi:hypothetical protein